MDNLLKISSFFVYFLYIFFSSLCVDQCVSSPIQENTTISKTNIAENVNGSLLNNRPKPIDLDNGKLDDECPKGMKRYYHEDDAKVGTWLCDCNKGLLYFAPTETCESPYQRGHCGEEEHLILPKKKNKAECLKNPCKKDNWVKFNGTCYELNERGPCKPSSALEFNESTFEIRCGLSSSDPRQLFRTTSIISAPLLSCPAGGRRDANGLCRPPL